MGIDISKAELDICLLRNGQVEKFTIVNSTRAIRDFLRKHLKEGNAIIGMENTGRYGWPLLRVLETTGHTVFVIPPLHLSRSLGLVRGKSDRIDAERICRFTLKNRHELKVHVSERKEVRALGVLLAERKRLLKMRGQLKKGMKELELMDGGEVKRQVMSTNTSLLSTLDAKVLKVEKLIGQLIRSDDTLSLQHRLLTSIPGIGPVLSWNIIHRTNEFLSIADPRKFACHAGVVPFEHSSGTSVRGRNRVSPFADRQFKAILHMAAMRAVRLEGELKQYYLRKVDDGKNRMSVLNAIRNKLIHRAFAVIRNNRPYENRLVVS